MVLLARGSDSENMSSEQRRRPAAGRPENSWQGNTRAAQSGRAVKDSGGERPALCYESSGTDGTTEGAGLIEDRRTL